MAELYLYKEALNLGTAINVDNFFSFFFQSENITEVKNRRKNKKERLETMKNRKKNWENYHIFFLNSWVYYYDFYY